VTITSLIAFVKENLNSVVTLVCIAEATAAVEISNASTQTFFTDLMKWYRLGHFPCCWEGKYPEGKLIVY
jgi:hypothetical protein